MKHPFDIKMGLRRCLGLISTECVGCPYQEDSCCKWLVKRDALLYIKQLERERDALKRKEKANETD